MKRIILLVSFLFTAMINNAQPKLEWAKHLGGEKDDIGKDISVDAQGNVYTIGYFQSSADFDPDSSNYIMGKSSTLSIFISKLDASGKFVWAKEVWGSLETTASAITTDKWGNVYCTGLLGGRVDFDPGPGIFNLLSDSFKYRDAFILKLNTNGDFEWVKKLGGNSSSNGFSITVDYTGNVYTSGYFEDTIDCDPDPNKEFNLISPGHTFISKLDASGNFVWAKKIGGTEYSEVDIEVDVSGNIYATGSFNDTADFDPGPATFNLTSAGLRDIFLLKLDASGNFAWAQRIGGTNVDEGSSLKVDASGSIYITGFFDEACDFDPDSTKFIMTSVSYADAFILKLNKNGNFIWAKQIGTISSNPSPSLELDNFENIYIYGYYSNTVDFDPGVSQYIMNGYGSYILKLNNYGNFLTVSLTEWTYGAGIALDSFNNIYTTGKFTSKVDFDPGIGIFELSPHTDGRSNSDIFVCKLSQDSCTNLSFVIDSLKNISCDDTVGYLSVHAVSGKFPYTYQWNTSPAVKDSVCSFIKSGIYSLTVQDANGCSHKHSVLINGPVFNSGYDFSNNLILNSLRPGRQTKLTAIGFNSRCESISGKFSIVLSKMVTFDKASPAPDKISGDTLFWNFSNLTYESKPLNSEINVTTDKKATIGDTVCFDVFITPTTGDANQSNNKKRYCYSVVNSYDPNIKSVYPQGACEQKYVLKDKPLTYTVQFQNTGNAEAIDIFILDTLDKNLDINSLRVIGQSHKPPITEILNGNVIKFRFDNIYLADSFSDEKASHGYIIFEVMPKAAVNNGTIVSGNAGIYFDFNPPVFTNEVSNTLTNLIPACVAGIPNPNYINPVTIYPNPNGGSFTLGIENPEKDIAIDVYNLMGEKIGLVESIPSQLHYHVDLNLSNGIYLVKVRNGERIYSKKVIVAK